MSYAKAMRHWRKPRKHKLTATRIRGNHGVFGKPSGGDSAEAAARKLKGK